MKPARGLKTGPLNSAIQAELRADYREAYRQYTKLARQGSILDRVGIYQAIARCFEKLGARQKAGYWHEKAGQGYLQVSSKSMGLQERAYYAMVEYRSAVQDYAPNLSGRSVARAYLRALAVCLKGGYEGYSHEMLFAGHLCAKIHEFKKAAQFFAETAEMFSKNKEERLARESYSLAAKYFMRCGDLTAARRCWAAGAKL